MGHGPGTVFAQPDRADHGHDAAGGAAGVDAAAGDAVHLSGDFAAGPPGGREEPDHHLLPDAVLRGHGVQLGTAVAGHARAGFAVRVRGFRQFVH